MADITEKEQEEYCYAQSGIRERHGSVPLWLKFVVAGLLVWSVYYLIQFWRVW